MGLRGMSTSMDQAAPGILLVLNDILETAEEEFNRWYQQQHVPERLRLPGFRSARRYRAVKGTPAYMAVYECDALEVLASEPYLERLRNPTDWTKKVMPGFRNMLRSACRETWSLGEGVGGAAVVIQCRPRAASQDAARRYVGQQLTRERLQAAAMVRASLWEADATATGASPEMALRETADKSADWVLFLESYDLARTDAALAALLRGGAADAAGLQIDAAGHYQLICARSAPPE